MEILFRGRYDALNTKEFEGKQRGMEGGGGARSTGEGELVCDHPMGSWGKMGGRRRGDGDKGGNGRRNLIAEEEVGWVRREAKKEPNSFSAEGEAGRQLPYREDPNHPGSWGAS